MRPAFASARQAIGFALMLAFLLTLPALLGGWGPGRDRRTAYTATGWNYGPFPWIDRQVFQETNDIDILVLGSSLLWSAVDARAISDELERRSGHPVTVRAVGWYWPGYDMLYFVAHDLLARRRVRTVVIYDDYLAEREVIHPTRCRLFRVGDFPGALSGLDWRDRIRLYGGATLLGPRRLLSLVRADRLGPDERWNRSPLMVNHRAPNVVERLGSLSSGVNHDNSEFVPFRVPDAATAADVVVHRPGVEVPGGDGFRFGGALMDPYQRHWGRLFGELCRRSGCRVIAVHLPTTEEPGHTEVGERADWRETLGYPVPVIGVPGRRFFGSATLVERYRLFAGGQHLNRNGQDYFTGLITPALLQLHAEPHRETETQADTRATAAP